MLQALWLQQIPPFEFRRRGVLAEHMLRILEAWYDDCVRNNLRLFGVDEVQDGVVELLNELLQPGNLEIPGDAGACEVLRSKVLRILN